MHLVRFPLHDRRLDPTNLVMLYLFGYHGRRLPGPRASHPGLSRQRVGFRFLFCRSAPKLDGGGHRVPADLPRACWLSVWSSAGSPLGCTARPRRPAPCSRNALALSTRPGLATVVGPGSRSCKLPLRMSGPTFPGRWQFSCRLAVTLAVHGRPARIWCWISERTGGSGLGIPERPAGRAWHGNPAGSASALPAIQDHRMG